MGWKQTEREVAKRLGGVRSGVVAQWGNPGVPDVVSDWLAVEVKSRRSLPWWLKDALAQARAGAGVEQLPIVVLHETNARHDDDMVMMRFKDFQDWFGDGG